MMSKEVSSNRENASTGYHVTSPERQLCEEMEKCYPPVDLKRLGIALLAVAALFVVAVFVLQ